MRGASHASPRPPASEAERLSDALVLDADDLFRLGANYSAACLRTAALALDWYAAGPPRPEPPEERTHEGLTGLRQHPEIQTRVREVAGRFFPSSRRVAND